MNDSLSRREFLKLGGAALAGGALSPLFPPDHGERGSGLIGRVAYESVSVFDVPRLDARTVGFRFRDELLHIYRKVTPLTGPAYNPLWFRVWGGYVHSAHVQEVRWEFNQLMEAIPEGGQLCEFTVPYSQPYDFSSAGGWQPKEDFRLYFQSTHWVTDMVEGPDYQPWYQITDELWDGFLYYVPATHLRPISDDEITPISPDVPADEKRVEVALEWQTLTAYEGNQAVFRTQVSTGVPSASAGSGLPTQTPTGRFNIYSKMPSKHMGLSRLTDTLQDRALPGVPWTAFFAPGGYAIHGAYWHNNFGWPMSRGCINMRNAEAKWLFRWLLPSNAPSDWESTGHGTQIIVA
jgi:lipoprotein-anchoring transpeptidase ErfK/SrfK